jgi:hypothetical protein
LPRDDELRDDEPPPELERPPLAVLPRDDEVDDLDDPDERPELVFDRPPALFDLEDEDFDREDADFEREGDDFDREDDDFEREDDDVEREDDDLDLEDEDELELRGRDLAEVLLPPLWPRPSAALSSPPPSLSPSESESSSSSPPTSFFATPTAAGMATPIAAPAITFFGVDRPPLSVPSSSIDEPSSSADEPSSSAAITHLLSRAAIGASCCRSTLRLVERVDEPWHDAIPHEVGAALGEVAARGVRGVLRERDERVTRRIPSAGGCRSEDGLLVRLLLLRLGAVALAPVAVAAAAAAAVRDRLADGIRRGSGRCGSGSRGQRGPCSLLRPLRLLLLLVLSLLSLLVSDWHGIYLRSLRRRRR